MKPEYKQLPNESDIQFTSGSTCEHARLDYMPEHIICYVVSGEMSVQESFQKRIYKAGDCFLIIRNTLVKCERRPGYPGEEFKVVYIILRDEFLQSQLWRYEPVSPVSGDDLQVIQMEETPSFTGLFHSLLPYFNHRSAFSSAMLFHKLEETLMCLLEQYAELAGLLFSSAAYRKLDLAEFMERNFMFNVPMEKFAELSGRSLSTFQRDFKRYSGVAAGKWLMERRLKMAHEILLKSARRPSDFFIEIDFEDLAHFSRSFKKHYGYNPSQVNQLLK